MESGNSKPYLFICCTPADQAWLEKVQLIFDKQNIRYVSGCFIGTGMPHEEEMLLLNNAAAFLVLITKNTAGSHMVNTQMAVALRRNIPILVLQDDSVCLQPQFSMQLLPSKAISMDAEMEDKLLQALPREMTNTKCEMRMEEAQLTAKSDQARALREMEYLRSEYRKAQESYAIEKQQRQMAQELEMRRTSAPPLAAPSQHPTPPPPVCQTASLPNHPTTKESGDKRSLLARIFGNKRKSDPIVPPPTMDSVQFAAVSNSRFAAGTYLPVDIVMYEDAFKSAVDELVHSREEKAQAVKSGYHSVERNSNVRVVLSSPDFSLDVDAEERTWTGKYLTFSFVVKIPKDYPESQLLLKAKVYINDLIATTLSLIIKSGQQVHVSRCDVVSAFVSYASQDRNQVAAIIQGMKKARPDMDIFFDIENLHSGQAWETALWDEIDKRDILFLCWSKAAKSSEWVEREWRYALEHKGEDAIEPIPIDSPDVCPPPLELSKKHFNDKMLYIIKSSIS